MILLMVTLQLGGCEQAPPPKKKVFSKKIIIPKQDMQKKSVATGTVNTVAPPAEIKAVATAEVPAAPAALGAVTMSPPPGTQPVPTVLASLFGIGSAKVKGKDSDRYDPKGKIDPFEPPFKARKGNAGRKKRKKPERELTPLEKIDLSQLRLTAIVQTPRGSRAMVEEASGKGYVIEAGTYIGRNGGQVIEVLPDRVVIEEEEEDIMGEVDILTREMKLPKLPGEG